MLYLACFATNIGIWMLTPVVVDWKGTKTLRKDMNILPFPLLYSFVVFHMILISNRHPREIILVIFISFGICASYEYTVKTVQYNIV